MPMLAIGIKKIADVFFSNQAQTYWLTQGCLAIELIMQLTNRIFENTPISQLAIKFSRRHIFYPQKLTIFGYLKTNYKFNLFCSFRYKKWQLRTMSQIRIRLEDTKIPNARRNSSSWCWCNMSSGTKLNNYCGLLLNCRIKSLGFMFLHNFYIYQIILIGGGSLSIS